MRFVISRFFSVYFTISGVKNVIILLQGLNYITEFIVLRLRSMYMIDHVFNVTSHFLIQLK